MGGWSLTASCRPMFTSESKVEDHVPINDNFAFCILGII